MAREHFSPYAEPWTLEATCSSTGDAFFPEYGAGHDEWDYLRSVCLNRCPVLVDCRDWVMRTELGQDRKTRHGVFAGMSPLERHKREKEWLAKQEGDAA